jgi:hypothetical protein
VQIGTQETNDLNFKMNFHHYKLCLLFSVLFSLKAFSQTGVQVSTHPGFLVPHGRYMLNMASYTIGGELAVQFHSTGNTWLDSIYDNPIWGVALFYSYLGNSTPNGTVIAINPYFQANVFKHKRSKTYFRLGTGVGFFTNPFDKDSNPKNKAIGSRLNGCMQGLLLNYRPMGEDYNFFYGFGLTHFSNGNYTKPNLGINVPQFNLGVEWMAKKANLGKRRYNALNPQKYLELRAGFAIKEVTLADPRKFTVYTFATTYGKPITPIRNLRFGMDLFYDRQNPYILFTPSTANITDLDKVLEAGFRIGHEYKIGIVTMTTDFGGYLYRPETMSLKRNTYILVGLNINPGKLVIGNRLKTHLGTADYFDWGAGVRLPLGAKKSEEASK